MFCEEGMCSLNDGYLQTGLNSGDYPDVPAVYPGGIDNCFTFADGQAEPRKWLWAGTTNGGIVHCPYAKDAHGARWSTSGLDVDWF
jgi:hypothetical protein